MQANVETDLAEAAFRQEQRERAPAPVRIACLLGVGAFVVFAPVDPLLVPGSVRPHLVARGGIIVVILALLGLSFTAVGRRHIEKLAFLACLAIGGGVVLMTQMTGGGESRYHEALLLTFLGFSLLIPWGPWLAGSAFAFLVALYDAVMLLTGVRGPLGTWLSNNAILWAGVVIATASVAVLQRLRREEFYGRFHLALANERLKELDETKSRFFANLSHELRTPLTLALAPVEALLEEDEALTDAQRQQLALVRRNALRLLRLVDDLLELSRLEAAEVRLRIETIDLGRMARDLVERTRPFAQRKNISVSLAVGDEPATVRGDGSQLERVLTNVLANAVKFTPDGGEVRVAVESGEDDVVVSISDTGEGIPSSALPHIFDRFYQADPSGTRRHGGAGIGLALAKEIVEVHGGSIAAESRVGQGTQVVVRLPRRYDFPEALRDRRRSRSVSVSDERRSPPPGLPEWHDELQRRDDYRLLHVDEATERRRVPRVTTGPQRETVLVVEDSPDLLTFVTGLLSAEYVVLGAPDGAAGLEMVRERRPDLVISDVMMPGMSGLDLVRAIRADDELAHTPVILLTARGELETRVEAREGGADVYLTKPFQPRELRAAVHQLLRKQERQTEDVRKDREGALRVLSEGVAHEILNPLGFLQTAIFVLRDAANEAASLVSRPSPRLEELLREIQQTFEAGQEGIARVRHAVEELRRFSRGGSQEPELPAQVNDIVERVLKLVNIRGLGLTVEASLEATRPVVVRSGQIEQVLLNLLLNARHAAGDGCRVELRTWDYEEGGVAIRLKDNGPGIPPENLERVFLPFFTTKGPGEGTGLGLALARRILREHGGNLTVDSRLGEGAAFTLWLPEDRSVTTPAPEASPGA